MQALCQTELHSEKALNWNRTNTPSIPMMEATITSYPAITDELDHSVDLLAASINTLLHYP
jgi:hypothetical protein